MGSGLIDLGERPEREGGRGEEKRREERSRGVAARRWPDFWVVSGHKWRWFGVGGCLEREGQRRDEESRKKKGGTVLERERKRGEMKGVISLFSFYINF